MPYANAQDNVVGVATRLRIRHPRKRSIPWRSKRFISFPKYL